MNNHRKYVSLFHRKCKYRAIQELMCTHWGEYHFVLALCLCHVLKPLQTDAVRTRTQFCRSWIRSFFRYFCLLAHLCSNVLVSKNVSTSGSIKFIRMVQNIPSIGTALILKQLDGEVNKRERCILKQRRQISVEEKNTAVRIPYSVVPSSNYITS